MTNLLLLITVLLSASFFTPEPPPPNPACRNGWSEMWTIEESKYCNYQGTYVLWFCYDYEECEIHFEARCYYNDEIAVEPPPVEIYFNYLPVVQKACTPPAFMYEGDCVVIGDPFP